MKAFADLYGALDGTTSTVRKVALLGAYLSESSAADAAWAVFFLTGGRPRRLLPAAVVRSAAVQAAGLSDWLFEECYQAVGDLAETIAHVLPAAESAGAGSLAEWVDGRLLRLRGMPADDASRWLQRCWADLDTNSRFVFNKLLTGGFRVGVSRQLVARALVLVSGSSESVMASRLIGYSEEPAATADATVVLAERYRRLVASGGDDEVSNLAQPFPFFLAQPLPRTGDESTGALPDTIAQTMQQQLGPADDWRAEWKWDGIRAQILKRNGQVWIWSRGEELMTDRFPEIAEVAAGLSDGTVLDGEILCWDPVADRVRPFLVLQTRIGRRKLNARILRDSPVVFMAYDCLESGGRDIRAEPGQYRWPVLEQQVMALSLSGNGSVVGSHRVLRLSPTLDAQSWIGLASQRENARGLGVEGLMLKRKDSRYGAGRTKSDIRGEWWKWKVDPYSIDAVLIYAQRGHGRRASLYTDYTFAVWSTDEHGKKALVPFAKAYSGLSDAEIREVDAVIRKTTVERFGPVRSVTPSMVFELGFEAISPSSRHKSGVAVRFPRMLRIRRDKHIEQANSLDDLKELAQGFDNKQELT